MGSEFISAENLSKAMQSIERLAGNAVSLHDQTGALLSAPTIEDPVVSIITSTSEGKKEYDRFISNSVATAMLRKDITILKAPTAQYHFFIPFHIKDTSFVISGCGHYLSLSDFNEFASGAPDKYGLAKKEVKSLSGNITLSSYENLRDVSISIRNLFGLVAVDEYKNNLYRKKYSRSKIILRLLSNINENISGQELYALMAEVLLFLFNVDSLSFLTESEYGFETVLSQGRLKETIRSLKLSRNNWILNDIITEKKSGFYDNPVDIRGLGLSEQVESVYLFPVKPERSGLLLICLLNSHLENGDEREIREICQIFSFLMTTISIKNDCINTISDIVSLSNATSEMDILFDNPDRLYESIVSTAVKLSRAERCSLMLTDNGEGKLTVKAVHGLNRWLIKDLKIASGEGIAGRVFRENRPVISKDIEKDFSIKRKPVYKTSSFISIPLKVGEATIGVLNISDRIDGEVFRTKDLELIRHFASYASIALQGSNYYNMAVHMKELSITDPLTDIFNRRYFQDRLTEEIDRSARHNLNFALCIIDIDDFKLFNDSEGHPAGDDLLKMLARLINSSLRSIDVLARIGGEEFAVIMPQSEREEAFYAAERIRNTVKKEVKKSWMLYPKDNVTVSIGISVFPADGTETKNLIVNADKALYRAKMHGKDRTFLWEDPRSI